MSPITQLVHRGDEHHLRLLTEEIRVLRQEQRAFIESATHAMDRLKLVTRVAVAGLALLSLELMIDLTLFIARMIAH